MVCNLLPSLEVLSNEVFRNVDVYTYISTAA